MLRFILLAMLSIASLPLSAVTLMEWRFDGGVHPGVSVPPNVKFQALPEKAPDGSCAAKFTMTADTLGKEKHCSCLIFNTKQKIVAGTRYIYKFYAKSDKNALFTTSCQMNVTPWKVVGGGRTLRLTGEWQEVSVEFPAGITAEGPVRMPQFFFGDLPKGTTLILSKVTLERKTVFLPATAIQQQWTFFPDPKLPGGKLPELAGIPDTLGGVKGMKLSAANGKINLARFCPPSRPQTPGFLMQVLESDKEATIQLGCSADYWFDFMVNGKSEYDTLGRGNGSTDYKPTDHVFNFPVKKGKNLIVVKVLSGSLGWKFVFGPVPFQQKLRKITAITRGKEWRPLKMGNPAWRKKGLVAPRIDAFKTIPGSALDLSQYLPRYDVDKMGRLKSDKAGRFYFEKAPGVPVRLRGFNNTYGGWVDRFYLFKPAEIEELAEEIRLRGFNVLRFHFWDGKFVGMNGFPKQGKDRKTIQEVTMAQTVSELPLDKKFVDRYFYFIKCLRDRGIYVMIDVFTSAGLMTPAVNGGADYPRFSMFYDAKYQNHFKAAAEFWLKTVNPYTKKRLLDDPQLVAITFYNEQEHLFNDKSKEIERFTPYWRKAVNDQKAPVFNFDLLRADTVQGTKARKFLRGEIDKMNEFYTKTIRGMGYQGFLVNWDMFMRNLEGYARRKNDAVAMHTYHAHPGQTALSPANYEQRLYIGGWYRGKMMTVSQDSSIYSGNYIGRAAATRVLGKPFMMTEYSHCAYNRYSSEAAVMWPAYASLQDWQMLAPHANAVALYYQSLQPYTFDGALNINAQVNLLCCAFAWQRGDVQSAKHAVSFHVPEKVLDSPKYVGAIGSGYNNLYMLTRIGSDYVKLRNRQADLNIEPQSFVGATSMGMWVQLQEEREDNVRILTEQINQLRKKKILPKENLTDPAKGIFQSETGEIIANLNDHSVTVDAPKFQAAAVKPGLKFNLSQLEIRSASVPCSIAAIVLDKAPSVSGSRHLLIVLNTMFVAENAVFSTPTFDAELDVGDIQLVTQAGKFDFSVKSKLSGNPKCYALNYNGSRECEVPVKLANGKLNFKLDTSLLKYGTPYFELVF